MTVSSTQACVVYAVLSLSLVTIGDAVLRASEASALVQQEAAGPAVLAAADFDEDGVPDLISGAGSGEGGVITVHRGNVDAIHPNTPAARARKSAGTFTTAPFLPGARRFGVKARPDFLHAGDFDADGHADVLAAASGGGAVVLRGDGAGSLERAQPIALPGVVTAIAVGDINGPDGLADVVFGVSTAAGPRLMVFAGYEGAWNAAPAVFDLPAPATAVALGPFDEEHVSDVAVAAGQELVVVHGKARRPHAARAAAPVPSVERRPLPAVEALLEAPSSPAVLRMRLDSDARDDLVTMPAGASAPTVITTLETATAHVVVNTNDSGAGSLRQAILAANATEGDDVITFDIPGPGPHVITPVTPLPPIVPDVIDNQGSVVIDGTSEPDFAGTPIVELSGAIVGAGGNGLTIAVPRCVVRGLAINRFAIGILFTITVDRSQGVSDGFVEGNYIGTDVTGTVALGNGWGVALGIGAQVDGANRMTVGGTAAAARNVISGNEIGVLILGVEHVIQGNFIGTDAGGTGALGNTSRGLLLISAAYTTIGGSAPGSRNIISGNGGDGVQLHESGLISITGNYIGTDVSGSLPLGNGGDGVDTLDSGMTVADNVISANALFGVYAPSIQSLPNIIGNRIGTNSAGTAALGNGQSGIESSGIGYTISGNLVSGNGAHGIIMRGLENVVQDNRIGTDITGTMALGNQGDGIQVGDMVNTIGGDGAGNVVAFNAGRGVVIDLDFTTFVEITSNSIHSNGGLGIDHGNDGVTPNDACDPESNDISGFPNFPVLTGATSSASSITVSGQLNSRPNAPFRLQFFSSPAPDPSGFGEGARLLGTATVTTDATCNASFSVTLATPVAAGQVVTATTTFTNEFGWNGTSEFSNAVPVVGPPSTEDAIRALMAQVQALVDGGDLTSQAGQALMARLRTALSLLERGKPQAAAQQLRVFINQVTLLVRTGRLAPPLGAALIDAASAIIAGMESS